MESSRRRKKTMAEIPHEILSSEILSRLPAKCVLRFKCVSKQWYSLLTTQMFKKTHLDHISDDDHHNPNKLLLLSACEFRTIDCEAPEDGVRVITRTRPIPFISRPTKIEILASFHGLVCVGVLKNSCNYYFSDLVLWNPLMAEWKTLSKTNYHKECYANTGIGFGLYYSSSDNDYKLLRVTMDDHCVYSYSLKSDSWRKVVDSTNSLKKIPYLRSERWRLSTWLNDNLYFLKQGLKGDEDSGPWSYSIIRFDTKTEKFTEIQAPSFEIHKGVSYFLSVQTGKIHFSLKYYIGSIRTCIKLWCLNGDGDAWTNVETYLVMSDFISCLKPMHFMRNKNWLMIHFTRGKCSLYKVDLEKTNRKGDGTCSYTHVNTGVPEVVRYIETFVSPNQYMNK